MQQVIQRPITDENFDSSWDYANNKLVEIYKKKIIRKVLVFFANITFFFCVSLITFDALQGISYAPFAFFLNTIEVLRTPWTIISPIIHHPELHGALQIIIYLAFAFIPAFAISGIVFLIIWFVYKPNVKKTKTEDKASTSKILLDLIKELQIRSAKVNGISSDFCALLYMFECLAIAGSFLMFLFKVPELIGGMENISMLIVILSNQFVGTMIGLVALTIVVLYASFNNLLSTILKIFYATKIDEAIEADAEAYYYECNPDLKAAFDEEEEILKRAKEITAKRTAEKNAFMTQINYKNPIYKYIKRGIIVLILIVSVLFVTSKLKELNIDQLIQNMGTESTEIPNNQEVEYEAN